MARHKVSQTPTNPPGYWDLRAACHTALIRDTNVDDWRYLSKVTTSIPSNEIHNATGLSKGFMSYPLTKRHSFIQLMASKEQLETKQAFFFFYSSLVASIAGWAAAIFSFPASHSRGSWVNPRLLRAFKQLISNIEIT